MNELRAERFPIYQSIVRERTDYADKVHTDLERLEIDKAGLDFDDLVSKHFNRLSQVDHPDASRQYVISSARMNMIEFAVKDINQNDKVDEAVQKIHDIEDLERRDRIMNAKQVAKDLVEKDQELLDIQEIKERS